MRKIKKIGALLLASVFMISTVACGGNGGNESKNTGTKEMTIEERMADSQKKMSEIKSAHMTMDMDMGMKVAVEGAEPQEMNMKTTGEIDMFLNPIKMKMSMTMDLGDLLGTEDLAEAGIDPQQTMEIYMEETDGTAMMYTGLLGQWIKQEADISSLTQYNPEETAKLYMESLSDVKELGTEEINGETTTKIEGTIKGDAVKEILDASGMGESMAQGSGLDQETLEKMLSQIKNFKMVVWLNEENYMVKVEEDLTEMANEMMAGMLEGTEEAGSISYTALKMTATYSDFNEVEDFTIPEEAKNATDISSSTTE